MSEVEHGPKGGELILVEEVPYELRKGLTKAGILKSMGQRQGFRCRHGWHKFVAIGEPATLAMIGMGNAAGVELASMHGRFYSDLKQCSRCGELGRHFR